MSLTAQDLKDIRTIVIDAFETLSTPRFDEIDERFKKVDARFENLEVRVGNIKTRVGQIETRLGSIDNRLENIEGRLEALENDVKDLYRITAAIQSGTITDKQFASQSTEKKLFTINAEVLALAKKLGVSLPR
jgi:archaellum component FlaC